VSLDEESPPAELAFSTHDLVVKSPGKGGKRRRGGSWLSWALLALVLGGMGAGGWLIWVTYIRDWMQDGPTKRLRARANFAYVPPAGFRTDDMLLKEAKANLAMTRKDPRCHLAAYYLDYKFREPGDEELIEEAVNRLKDYFPQLQYKDPLQSDGKGRGGSLGDEPALVLTFRAVGPDEVPVVGECLMLARRGYGYWLMTWGPEKDAEELQEIWEQVRAGFRHGDGREGWKPTERPSERVPIADLGISISYVKEVWQAEDSLDGYDRAAKVVLRGYELALDENGHLRRQPYAGRLATIQLLALPPAADLKAAAEAAQAHVTKTLGDVTEGVKVEPMKDRGSGKPIIDAEVGELKGEVRHLEVRLPGGKSEFALLAVAVRPEGVLALFCQCPAAKRGYWLPELKEVIASVRRK
jgi:hypothetical protein